MSFWQLCLSKPSSTVCIALVRLVGSASPVRQVLYLGQADDNACMLRWRRCSIVRMARRLRTCSTQSLCRQAASASAPADPGALAAAAARALPCAHSRGHTCNVMR